MGQTSDIQREYFDAAQAGDLDKIRSLCHPEYVYTDEKGVEHDIEGSMEMLAMYTNAFSDFKVDVHRRMEMGDVAVMEATISGVHSNDMPGVPATGRAVEVEYCDIMEIRDGAVFREHDYHDNLDLMQQLGAASAPA